MCVFPGVLGGGAPQEARRGGFGGAARPSPTAKQVLGGGSGRGGAPPELADLSLGFGGSALNIPGAAGAPLREHGALLCASS